MTHTRSRTQIENLEIVVAIHADGFAITGGHEQHIDGAQRIKGPDVYSLVIDLRLDEAEGILPCTEPRILRATLRAGIAYARALLNVGFGSRWLHRLDHFGLRA